MRLYLKILGSFCILCNLCLIYLKFDEINLSDEALLNLQSCPYCYGNNICQSLTDQFQPSRFALDLTNSFINTYFLQSLFNIKNIFMGREIFTNRKIVFKKLAHNSELSLFDLNEKNDIKNVAKKTFLSRRFDIDELRKISNKLEIEMFKNEENWPFPKLYGSCGRLMIESHEGNTLEYYINHPFKLRAKIALRFIESLKQIYANKEEFSIYLFDLGFENVSYNEEKDMVYFIDAEDLLIVDKRQFKKENSKNWNETFYFNEFEDCDGRGDCLSYSSEKICRNFHVDLNYYSACRNVLSKYAIDINNRRNFLHSIPPDLDAMFKLDEKLNNCAEQSNRFDVIEQILDVLNKITSLN